MNAKKRFADTVSYNLYLNALTGLFGINIEQLITSPCTLKLLFCYGVVSDALVLIFTTLSTIRLVSVGVPLAERCITFLTHSTFLQSLTKFSYLILRRKKFQRFCDTWDASFHNSLDKANEDQLQNAERRRVKMITTCLLVQFVLTAVPWVFLPAFQILQDIHGGRYLNVPVWIPFIDVFKSPSYEIVLGVTSFASYFTITKNIAFDGLFFALVSLEIVQLQHLKFAIGKIFEDRIDFSELHPIFSDIDGVSTDGGQYSQKRQNGKKRVGNVFNLLELKENDETIKDLSIWVKHHQQAMILGEMLHDLYSPTIIFQFVTTTMILCFTAFTMTSVHLDMVQYVLTTLYCLGCSLQLFLLCHYGDRLAEASVSLSEACFSSGWHKTNIKRVRSSMLIILQRIQKPLTISFYGVYPLSAEMFVNIMQGSISYLMILLNLTSEN